MNPAQGPLSNGKAHINRVPSPEKSATQDTVRIELSEASITRNRALTEVNTHPKREEVRISVISLSLSGDTLKSGITEGLVTVGGTAVLVRLGVGDPSRVAWAWASVRAGLQYAFSKFRTPQT